MKLMLDEELLQILKQISVEDKTLNEWEQVESCDMFQTEHYCGGFDATEGAFCFSYYDNNNDEYWFQLTLEEIKQLLSTREV